MSEKEKELSEHDKLCIDLAWRKETHFINVPLESIWGVQGTREIKAHEAWAHSLAFNRNGKYLVSGDNAERIFVWASRIDYMAEDICSKISRNLTTREWENYVGYDIDYQKTCANK